MTGKDFYSLVLGNDALEKVYDKAESGDAAAKITVLVVKNQRLADTISDCDKVIAAKEDMLNTLKLERAGYEASFKKNEAEIAKLMKEAK